MSDQVGHPKSILIPTKTGILFRGKQGNEMENGQYPETKSTIIVVPEVNVKNGAFPRSNWQLLGDDSEPLTNSHIIFYS